MLLSGAVRRDTKEPYRNHICIQDELRWRGRRDREEGGRAALLPSTEQLHIPFFSPSLHPFIYCLPPSILSTPTTPSSSSSSSHSQHASPCIVFPESSKVGGSLLIRAEYCKRSAMDELICVRECVREPALCTYDCVYVPRRTRVSVYV